MRFVLRPDIHTVPQRFRDAENPLKKVASILVL